MSSPLHRVLFRFLLFLCCFVFGGSLALAAGPYPPLTSFQKITEVKTYTVKGKTNSVQVQHTLRYRLFVPDGYSDAANKSKIYPIVLFLHGLGERGTDNELQIKRHNYSHEFVNPVNRPKYPSFFMAPQYYDLKVSIKEPDGSTTTRNYSGWHSLIRQHLFVHLTQTMTSKWRLDTSRFYITGLSMGGGGTWSMITDYPTTFAAAVPICGWGPTSKAPLIKSMPIWAFHAADDPTVNVSGTDNMINAIKKAGGNPLYTRYATGGHGIWKNAYTDPKLVPWVFAQKLNSPVQRAPKITAPTTLADGREGVVSKVSFTASGSTPLTWTTTGTLPPGLSLNKTSGAYGGTPTKAGKYTFSVIATNTHGKDTRSYTHTILPKGVTTAPKITAPNFLADSPINAALKLSFVATGSTPLTWTTSGTLPAGLTLNKTTGLYSGTPTKAGRYTFSVSVTNSAGKSSKQYTHTIIRPSTGVPAQYDSPDKLQPGEVGKVFDVNLNATGTAPLSWAVTKGTLPPGLKLDKSTGKYSGTPTKQGSYSFTVTVSNNLGNSDKALTHLIKPAQGTGEVPAEMIKEPVPQDGGVADSTQGDHSAVDQAARPDSSTQDVENVDKGGGTEQVSTSDQSSGTEKTQDTGATTTDGGGGDKPAGTDSSGGDTGGPAAGCACSQRRVPFSGLGWCFVLFLGLLWLRPRRKD